jgi:hypothetical protein
MTVSVLIVNAELSRGFLAAKGGLVLGEKALRLAARFELWRAGNSHVEQAMAVPYRCAYSDVK